MLRRESQTSVACFLAECKVEVNVIIVLLSLSDRSGIHPSFVVTSDRHEGQLAELEKRWLEQIEGLKKSQEMLEIER